MLNKEPQATESKRGQYIYNSSGCGGCHGIEDHTKTRVGADNLPMAGGRPIKTPYGVFYSPNITPDKVTGIGSWTFEEFRKSMTEGKAPDGMPYYPVFPYTSYKSMTERDLRDLWNFIRAQPAYFKPNKQHELDFPFSIRTLMYIWQFLFFEKQTTVIPDNLNPAEWKRGAYLVQVLGHCGECHTPRNIFGAMNLKMELSGNPRDLNGKIPDLTSKNSQGIFLWSKQDIKEYLSSGMTPEGDFAGGKMAEVIENSTSKLSPADVEAIAVYLKSLH